MRKVQIEVITYERDRLDYFTKLMTKAQKKYSRLFKKYKDAPLLSAETEMLNAAGRVAQFYGDVVELLEKGYRKQSEGEWVETDYKTFEHGFVERRGKAWKCTNCLHASKRFDNHMNFCPNCGAKMKGGAE